MWATSCDRWLIGIVVMSLVFLGQSLVNADCVQNECIMIDLAVHSSDDGLACYRLKPKDCHPCWGGRNADGSPIKDQEGECIKPGVDKCVAHATEMTDWEVAEVTNLCKTKCAVAKRGYSQADPLEGVKFLKPKSHPNFYCKGQQLP